MRLLFEIDEKNYDPNGVAYIRPSARCIAVKNGKVAMVHSVKYNYYKFPGGGIEAGERPEDALIRETREEAGLTVLPGSIREFGLVRRVQKSYSPGSDYFVQDNYYYLCATDEHPAAQELDNYEADEGFTLEWINPAAAVSVNRAPGHGPKDQTMLEREARVLEILQEEGYFG